MRLFGKRVSEVYRHAKPVYYRGDGVEKTGLIKGVKAKQLAKLIERGAASGLTPEQQLAAKSAFLAHLLIGLGVDIATAKLSAEKSRAKKLDLLIDTLKGCDKEVSEDDIKRAHCAVNSNWARAVISVCLGFKVEALTIAGLPPGYIAPLPK
jgi:hypothetical protein